MISIDVSIKSWRSSVVEQLICNQQVGGSNPFASSNDMMQDTGCTMQDISCTVYGESWIVHGASLSAAGRWLSGQRQQTVNLPARAYAGSNPALPTKFFIMTNY